MAKVPLLMGGGPVVVWGAEGGGRGEPSPDPLPPPLSIVNVWISTPQLVSLDINFIFIPCLPITFGKT